MEAVQEVKDVQDRTELREEVCSTVKGCNNCVTPHGSVRAKVEELPQPNGEEITICGGSKDVGWLLSAALAAQLEVLESEV